MKNIASWLLVMFLGMFWLFRVAVAFQEQYGKDFGGFIVFNSTIEVILLFVVILCIILFLRRMLVGGIVLIISYGYYFGGYIFTTALPAIMEGNLSIGILQNAFVSAIAIILAFGVLADLLLARVRLKNSSDKKTDWFFDNEQYDRKLDERADKNQYRNY